MYLFKRAFSCASSPHTLHRLKQRSLIRISGENVIDFLQGIVTNDVNRLTQSPGCIYSLILNTRGRVIYDTLIYRTRQQNSLLVESDSASSEALQKHLKIYRVRRQISVENVEGGGVYVIYNKDGSDSFDKLPNNTDLAVFQDPRLLHLGLRVLPVTPAAAQQLQETFFNVTETCSDYRKFRYKLGVGEGPDDFPPNNCFPLESNCDYLNGVSFDKGCYIGQELTARVQHTGVVRKRLMPLLFKTIPTSLPVDNAIVHDNVKLGKLRGIEGDVGLALLNVDKSLKFKEIAVGNGVAKVAKPSWWPGEQSQPAIKLTQTMEENVFKCNTCVTEEKYSYFGKAPPFLKDYKFKEDVYVVEDPFSAPSKGQFVVLGANCVKCASAVCKDVNCSFYYGGTYCIKCAKEMEESLPESLREKLNRIVVSY